MITAESTHRRPRRGGIEVDALTVSGQRHLTWRAGERHAIKARHARRTRRTLAAELAAMRTV